MKRNCEYCEKKLTGRAGQRFCSDNCRNNYNNSLNRDYVNAMRNINNQLRRNRRILQSISGNVSKSDLQKLGFDFNLHTSIKDGVTYCYDYGYEVIKNDVIVTNSKEKTRESKQA